MRWFGCILLLLVGETLFAGHDVSASPLQGYGIRFGVDVSSLGTSGFTPGYGIQAGGLLEFLDIHGLSAILEVNYSSVALDYNDGPEGARIGYVSLPVMMKFRGGTESVRPHLILGIQLDRQVSTEFDADAPYEIRSNYLASSLEPWVWRGSFGLGVTANRQGLSLLTEVRATFDISNSFTESLDKVYGSTEVSMVSLTFGILR